MVRNKNGIIYQNDIWNSGVLVTKVQIRVINIGGHKCLVLLVLNFNIDRDYAAPLVKRLDKLLHSWSSWINARKQVILPKNLARSVAQSYCLRVRIWAASFLEEKEVKKEIDKLPSNLDELFY